MALSPRVRTTVIPRRTPDTTAAAVSTQKSIASLSGAFDTFFDVKTQEEIEKIEAKAAAENKQLHKDYTLIALENPEELDRIISGDLSFFDDAGNLVAQRTSFRTPFFESMGAQRANRERNTIESGLKGLGSKENLDNWLSKQVLINTRGMSSSAVDGYSKRVFEFGDPLIASIRKQRKEDNAVALEEIYQTDFDYWREEDSILPTPEELAEKVMGYALIESENTDVPVSVTFRTLMVEYGNEYDKAKMIKQSYGQTLAENEQMLRDIQDGVGLGQVFTTKDTQAAAEKALGGVITNQKADIARTTKSAKRAGIAASKGLMSGKDIPDAAQTVVRMKANNPDGTLTKQIKILEMAILEEEIYREYTDPIKSPDNFLINRAITLRKKVQSRKPNPLFEQELEVVERELLRRATAERLGDELNTGTVMDDTGKVDDQGQLETDIVETELSVGREISPIKPERVEAISLNYNTNVGSRDEILGNLIGSIDPARIPRVISSFVVKNPDLAVALDMKTRGTQSGDLATRLLFEGQQILDENPVFAASLLIEAEKSARAYFEFDPTGALSASQYKTIFSVYKALTPGETVFKPDQMEKATQLVLALAKPGQMFKGSKTLPFEPDMTTEEMNDIWSRVTMQHLLDMNGGVPVAVVIESDGINEYEVERELTFEELNTLRQTSFYYGLNGFVLEDGTLVQIKGTKKRFLFNYRDFKEELNKMPNLLDAEDVDVGVELPIEQGAVGIPTGQVPVSGAPEARQPGDISAPPLETITPESVIQPTVKPETIGEKRERIDSERFEKERRQSAAFQRIQRDRRQDELKRFESAERRIGAFKKLITAFNLNDNSGDESMKVQIAAIIEVGRVSTVTKADGERYDAFDDSIDELKQRVKNIIDKRGFTPDSRLEIKNLAIELTKVIVRAELFSIELTKKQMILQGISKDDADAAMLRSKEILERAQEELNILTGGIDLSKFNISDNDRELISNIDTLSAEQLIALGKKYKTTNPNLFDFIKQKYNFRFRGTTDDGGTTPPVKTPGRFRTAPAREGSGLLQ
jgi:hypothetical protein